MFFQEVVVIGVFWVIRHWQSRSDPVQVIYQWGDRFGGRGLSGASQLVEILFYKLRQTCVGTFGKSLSAFNGIPI